jgi:hypothetical protein
MAAPVGPSHRSPSLLYAVLGLAILVGVGASLMIASAPPPPQARSGQVIVDLPESVWGLLFLSPLIAGFAAILYRRLTEPSLGFPTRALVLFVVILLLGAFFVFSFAETGGGRSGQIYIYTSPPPTNHSGSNGTNGTGPNGTNGTHTNLSGGLMGASVLRLPPWFSLALVLGLVGLVGALAIPGLIARLVDRAPRVRGVPPPDRGQVRAALSDAEAAIDRGEDPRETVVRLYVRLLSVLGPKVGDLSCLTADEIRVRALAALGVRPSASEALTRLFEEARYSTHPIGPAESGRFREAVHLATTDLMRGLAS